jgi:hypothetical protein
MDAWEDRNGPAVFSTADEHMVPNAVWVTCVSIFDEETVIVADNYFDKTKKNLDAGSKGSLLFITGEKKSYQLKGRLEYYREGRYYDDMKSWNPEKHPGHAAAVLKVEEVHSGSEKLA